MDYLTFLSRWQTKALIWDIVCIAWATYLVFFQGVGAWVFLIAILFSYNGELYQRIKFLDKQDGYGNR